MEKPKVNVRKFETIDATPVSNCIEKSLSPLKNTFADWEESLNELRNIAVHTSISAIWVAEYDSKVIGVARQSPKTPFIDVRSQVRLLIGDPDYLDLHVERALIQVCIWKARKCNASELILSIHPECKTAVNSALEIGFRKEIYKHRREMPFDRYTLTVRCASHLPNHC